ncbi:integrase [Stenotrophomonas maltophilia]|uniref:Integrase n=1 Tax=Stenotrophomonas maltophilia TaxID=40324 RepID=A0A246HI46_STEMA|nr:MULTISPECIES: HNH endonuclease [Pseudomonadota]MBH1755647.1 HNH endonuclease [Stenotrophomonas maltophilia]MBH1810631.1 HNH endonuclease [Stenotrophomonas maltophilia]OWQ50067.1 integrase [Stenotrophomonas maltophilia]WAT86285.1 HNH endonuclease [Delftia acidovorans]
MKKCWLCPNPLEGNHRTGEHIIPSAIGGRKEVHDFICRSCNSTRGNAWEAELARQFLWFSSAAGIKRGRGGTHPDFKVETASGEKLRLRADSVLVPDGHDISTEESGNRIEVAIRANDPRTIKNLLKKIAVDHPEFDFKNATTHSEQVDSYLDEPLCMNFRYGGPAAGRSMVKSCLALLSEVDHIETSNCAQALAYLLDPSLDAPSPFYFFFDADLVENRPQNHLFHCVSVVGQPREGRILGYVELFNFARLLILIADEYNGPDFQETYAIDPVEGKTLDLAVDFSVVGRLNDLPKIASEPPKMYLEAFQHTGNIVQALNNDRVRALAISKACEGALKALGLAPSAEEVPPEFKDEWIRLFMQNLRPYIESTVKRAAS